MTENSNTYVYEKATATILLSKIKEDKFVFEDRSSFGVVELRAFNAISGFTEFIARGPSRQPMKIIVRLPQYLDDEGEFVIEDPSLVELVYKEMLSQFEKAQKKEVFTEKQKMVLDYLKRNLGEAQSQQ